METRTERLTDAKGNCAELCTIIHEGKEFTSGGAAMWTDEAGKLRGILYVADSLTVGAVPTCGNARSRERVLTSWDGSLKIHATLASVWENSFVDYHGRRQVNQSFYFTIKGRKCRGVNYNREWSQIVRFKEV